MKIVLLAPPGAGKGTQGKRLSEHYGVPHIAIGDLLRDNVERDTEVGRQVKDKIESGELVSDDLVLRMVKEALEASGSDGFILDGYPRTVRQAEEGREVAEAMGMGADVAIFLATDQDELIRRLRKRATEEGRDDDSEDVIRQRLATYQTETAPVIDYYRDRGLLTEVDGMEPIDTVTTAIVERLKERFPDP